MALRDIADRQNLLVGVRNAASTSLPSGDVVLHSRGISRGEQAADAQPKKPKPASSGGRGGVTKPKQSTIQRPSGAAKTQRGRGATADLVEEESEADKDEEDEEEEEDIEHRVWRLERNVGALVTAVNLRIEALVTAVNVQVNVAREFARLKAGLRRLGGEDDTLPNLPAVPAKRKPAAKATAKTTTRKTAVAVPTAKVTKPAPRKTATARKARGSILKAAEATSNVGSSKAAKQTKATPASVEDDDEAEADESGDSGSGKRDVGYAGVNETSMLSDAPDESLLGGRQALERDQKALKRRGAERKADEDEPE